MAFGQTTNQPAGSAGRIPAYSFHVEIAGIIEGAFLKCKGLSAERKVFQYKEGGVNNYVHQLPDRLQYGKVTFERGVAFSNQLWEWFMTGQHTGQVRRTNISILLFATDSSIAKRWNLFNAYPTKWTAPSLETQSKAASIESLVLVHHGISM